MGWGGGSVGGEGRGEVRGGWDKKYVVHSCEFACTD